MKTTTIDLRTKEKPTTVQLKRKGDRIRIINPFDEYYIEALAVTPPLKRPPRKHSQIPFPEGNVLSVYFLLLVKTGCVANPDSTHLFIGRSGQLKEAEIGQFYLEGWTTVVHYRLDGTEGTFTLPGPNLIERGDQPENKNHPCYQGPLLLIDLMDAKTEQEQ